MIDSRLRKKCLNLFLSRYTLDNIVKQTGVSKKTLYNWKQQDKWDEIKEVNLTDAEKIENRLSGLVLKMIDKANQSADKQSLANLEYAVKIYDEHQKTSLVKSKR
ncbi:MAG: hypothetical protein HND39_01805 [Ignavibacteriota bacterium]|jgi:uncharacterized protein YjcR|nr:hypothetical protein [Ignavibacteriota bacterium]MCC7094931.1 hypothetical protein [Ignavibacteriaceae bacterium]MCE7856244.1 hypothetical protein [Ignavibacteria bacterium CHB3]MEB2297678.1 phage terminase small subunit-related protein [Ignavibacteria bacterium]NUM61302.1 hypothetical protein [Ignavibacteriaceae bacterium]